MGNLTVYVFIPSVSNALYVIVYRGAWERRGKTLYVSGLGTTFSATISAWKEIFKFQRGLLSITLCLLDRDLANDFPTVVPSSYSLGAGVLLSDNRRHLYVYFIGVPTDLS